jgi:cation:H+ antiporter
MNMPLIISALLYLLVVGAVVFLSLKLAKYCDQLVSTTKLSAALIGGILLGAVTSLPELFTTVTAIFWVGSSQYVIGNIFGSNLFDFTILFALFIFFHKNLAKYKISKYLIISCLFSLALYGAGAIGVFGSTSASFSWLQLGFINIASLLIIIIYIVSIIKTPKIKDEEEAEKVYESPKIILTKFAITSVLLVGISIVLTLLADQIAGENGLNLDPVVGGAIFLGVATSLPEVVATISLAHKKNFDTAIFNIVGSSNFNFSILFIADILTISSTANLYEYNKSSGLLILFGALSILITAIGICVNNYFKGSKKLTSFIYILIGSVFIINYALYFIFVRL